MTLREKSDRRSPSPWGAVGASWILCAIAWLTASGPPVLHLITEWAFVGGVATTVWLIARHLRRRP